MDKPIMPGLHKQVIDKGLRPIVCVCGCNTFCAGMDLVETNETAGDIRLSCTACGNWTLWFRPMRSNSLKDPDKNQLLLPENGSKDSKGLN